MLPVCLQISGPVVSKWALLFAVLSNWLVHTALSSDSANLLACIRKEGREVRKREEGRERNKLSQCVESINVFKA